MKFVVVTLSDNLLAICMRYFYNGRTTF